MKIKIIDLLVKIANGEQVPEKIKYENKIWEYDVYSNDYKGEDIWLFEELFEYRRTIEFINDEIEIIKEPKKIEKIKSNGDEFYSDYIDAWINKNKTDAYCEFLMNKINELIDEINNIKEK